MQIKNNYDMCLKLFEIQRCDALAHHPDKLEKRKKSKEKLINKRFPNLTMIDEKQKKADYVESNKALDEFQTVLCNYQDYLADRANVKEVKLEEVMLYFNKYFDAI